MDLVQGSSSSSTLVSSATTNVIQDTWLNSNYLWTSVSKDWASTSSILKSLLSHASVQGSLISTPSIATTLVATPNTS